MSSGVHGRRSPAEWFTLALSLLIVGSLVVIALVEESQRLEDDGTSISVTFETESSKTVEGNHFVPYTVTNTGSSAISSADIWIEVYDGESLVESAEITVQFLPLDGKQDGIYVSAYNPSSYTLRGRLESLQFP
jgi:uncharacterized protein (TIGR02588 family)